MREELTERIIEEANYIVENRATVRDCGRYFSISKSTVHKDVTHRLFYVSRSLYNEVRGVLDENKAQRHLRGGMATKNKYLKMKSVEEVYQA